MSDGYQILALDELETASHRGSNLIPVRHALGFRPAGVNAWKADAGGRLIPPHEEDGGNEELYAVVRGRARFTVGEEEAEAPAGTLVFVPPEVFRTAVAAEDGTIVFVVGGTVGEAFDAAGWDSFALADTYRQAGRVDEGKSTRSAARRPALPGAARVNLVHIDELDAIEMPEGFTWRPVRRRFGIRAFGTNAYTPGSSGQVVEEHTEGQLEHEEMYLVLRGRVRFTTDGDEHELEPGQLVFVRDPSLKRGGVALTDDAAVLAVGGRPGRAHEISAWEYAFAAMPHIDAGDFEQAERVMNEGLAEKPGDPALLYNLACLEARAGKTDAALDHLNTAADANERLRKAAQTDEDFASIRDDSRFPS